MPYTPIFDSLFNVPKINLTDAATFGAVWRYAQGELKKCTASPETIAGRVGMTHNPVRQSLKKLCNLGLLTDLTPTVKYKPHEYVPTQKALKIIAGEIEVLNDRLPDSGNLNQATNDDRLPESGNPGYQNQEPRLPESGNKETINKGSIREKENPGETQDYLATVVNGQGKVTDKTDSNPEDQYFEYRDKFLATYRDMTGEYPEPLVKDEISTLITIGITPAIWAESWRQCKLNWSGKNKIPLARVIEVCKFGGDYEKWRQAKYPEEGNGRDSPPKPKYITVPVTQESDDNGQTI